MMNSDSERTVRNVLIEQEKIGYGECWVGNAKAEASEIGLVVSKEILEGKPKSTWKKEVKEKIEAEFLKKAEEKKQQGKKMRFLRKNGADTYLKEVHNGEAVTALKICLNMISWIEGNFGNKVKCPLCGEDDTTEHVFFCNGMKNEAKVNVCDLENGEKMAEIVKLFDETEKKRREHWLENIVIKFDVLRREGT